MRAGSLDGLGAGDWIEVDWVAASLGLGDGAVEGEGLGEGPIGALDVIEPAQAANPTPAEPKTSARRTARRETRVDDSVRPLIGTLQGAARVAVGGIATLIARREPFLALRR
jgi:hypothetical protein